MTKTITMSREEVECGYCKRVQTNRGGNLGYNCKKHRKSGMSITKITLYTEEQLKEKLTSRDNEWRERIIRKAISVFRNEVGIEEFEWDGGESKIEDVVKKCLEQMEDKK